MAIDLAVIVPTRGRPENIRKVLAAWDFTNAWDVADLILAVDADDPEYQGYRDLFEEHNRPDTGEQLFSMMVSDVWVPMVYKLNKAAVASALSRLYFAVGFAGDDHLPQTINWAQRYLTVLRDIGSGMVYGDDGYQGAKLSTEWAVTADVVRTLNRMVPADVEHMYCDNAMMDLFGGAGALRHLPEVRIEHMHPIVGKAETDAQYQRVNHRDQFNKDRYVYETWRDSPFMRAQVGRIRHLREGLPEWPVPGAGTAKPTHASKPRPTGRAVRRSGPTNERIQGMARFPFTSEFKHVRGATPDEIGMALADFASAVPADQEIVELGVFQGRTALIMAWGAAQGHGAHVTGIDPWDLEGNVYDPPFTDPESKAWAEYRINELGYSDRITLVNAFSHQVAERWSVSTEEEGRDGQKVGLLFVDGDHTRQGARRDIEVWAPHLAPGAVIAIDDYGHPDWPGVGEAVDELVAEGFLAPIEIFHDRLAVTRLTGVIGVIGGTDSIPTPRAITSEGVSPTLYAVDVLELGGERAVTIDLGAPSAVVPSRDMVGVGELDGVPAGTVIDALNLTQLKALAKARGIVLGIRKDKRALIIEALEQGR